MRDNRCEDRALVHGEIGHRLAVQFDPGKLGAVDELRIGQAFFANGSVDALDPQGAEAALLDLAIAIGILPSLFNGLAGDADGVLATAR